MAIDTCLCADCGWVAVHTEKGIITACASLCYVPLIICLPSHKSRNRELFWWASVSTDWTAFVTLIYCGIALSLRCQGTLSSRGLDFFFLDFPIYLQSVEIHSDTFSKLCVGKRGWVEERSVAPFRNKRVKTCVAVGEESVQTKEKYELRLTTKAWKLIT
jgi:hypothetical protein